MSVRWQSQLHVVGRCGVSRNDQPHQEDAGYPEEHLGDYLVLTMLLATHGWGWASIADIECGGKQSEREGTNPKGHVEAIVSKAKRGE